jgi:hypothetical protein
MHDSATIRAKTFDEHSNKKRLPLTRSGMYQPEPHGCISHGGVHQKHFCVRIINN